jgi:hypothetical protein
MLDLACKDKNFASKLRSKHIIYKSDLLMNLDCNMVDLECRNK